MKNLPVNLPPIKKRDKLINYSYFVILPLILGIALGGLYYAITTYGNLKNVAQQNQGINKQVRSLSEQNKQLSQDNNRLQAKNIAYTKCIADIFAKYTQDLTPVIIEDLDICATKAGESAASTESDGGAAQGASTGTSQAGSNSSSTNNAPSTPTPQSNPSQPNTPSPPPSFLPPGFPVVCVQIGLLRVC